MNKAFKPDQPIVLIDATTGQRQLIWAELDSNATSPQETDLIIRVGKNLKEGHRYIVAMRDLQDRRRAEDPGAARVRPLPGRPEDEHPGDRAAPRSTSTRSSRRSRTPASSAATSTTPGTSPSRAPRTSPGGCCSIRDNGLAQLGDNTPGDGIEQGHAPDFTITDVKTVDEPSPGPGHEDLAVTDPSHGVENVREVTGTFQVPCYLNQVGCPSGSRFNLGADGLPHQTPGNFYTANFTCNIPQSAVHEQTPGAGDWQVVHPDRPSMYGHGLFGDAGEVHTDERPAARRRPQRDHLRDGLHRHGGGGRHPRGGSRPCATCRTSRRCPTACSRGSSTSSTSGGCMSHPDGFAGDPAFKFGGQSAIDTSKGVFYYGNSQGGIAGGALTAVEPDVTRSVLYVPGMNYSTLLTRSVDFSRLRADPLSRPIPDESERPLLLSHDPDGVGPRRAGRLRQPHDHRPAAGHAGAPRPDRDGLRRPSGRQRRHGGRGAHDRRAAAAARRSIPAGRRARTPTSSRSCPRSGHSRARRPTATGSSSGTSARSARTGRAATSARPRRRSPTPRPTTPTASTRTTR